MVCVGYGIPQKLGDICQVLATGSLEALTS